MAKVEFMKSTLPEIYSQALNQLNMIFAANYADIIGYVSIAGVGDLLRNIKSLEHPTTMAFKDETGKIVVAATVEHVPSEDAEHPEGNWRYSWTFNEADIPEGTEVVDLNNEMTKMYFVKRAGDKYGMEYKAGCLVPMHTLFFKCMKEYLESNAGNEDGVELELPNVFLARAAVEDGETVLSIEPIGKMVQLIKDDCDLEV
jgi:hypothetical protein